MKKINYILLTAVILVLAMSGCKQDPFNDIVSNERAIDAIKIVGEGAVQVGPAQIVRDSSKAYVLVLLNDETDVSNVKLDITPSYKGRVEGSSDEVVNFDASGGQITRTIISESGEKREWTIKIKYYILDVDGTWNLSEAKYFYDVSKLYGASDWTSTKSFTDPFAGFGAELDNKFTFTFAGVDSDGNPYGTFTNDAGADGKYGTYIWNGNTVTDFSYKFKKMPSVSGTWLRDLAANTIIFNKGESDESESLPLEWDGDQTFTVPFNPGPNDVVWDNDWGRMELQATDKFWFKFTK
jgi:hypothetical protein